MSQKDNGRKQAMCAPMYAILYAELRLIAKGHGYALAIHGSMKRDLDLIAVPWVQDASTPEKLVNAIREFIGCGYTGNLNSGNAKPHNRLTYVFHLDEHEQNKLYGDGPYIDLSVMPLIQITTNEVKS